MTSDTCHGSTISSADYLRKLNHAQKVGQLYRSSEAGLIRLFVCVNLADVNEVESRTADVDTVPRLLPEVQRSVNAVDADTNADDVVYLNDDMELDDDLVDFGGIEELVGSDLFGFQNARSEAASGHYQARALSSQQTTSSGNNSVCWTFTFLTEFTDTNSDTALMANLATCRRSYNGLVSNVIDCTAFPSPDACQIYIVLIFQNASDTVVKRLKEHFRLGDRNFAVAGPRLWNSLPAELRQPDIELGEFRRLLKTFLFT